MHLALDSGLGVTEGGYCHAHNKCSMDFVGYSNYSAYFDSQVQMEIV